MATATKNLAFEELLPPATDQNEMGKAINNEKKEKNPRRTTGSLEKSSKIKSTIDYNKLRSFRSTSNHLLASLNKKPPPNIERKTGIQAAKKGLIIPFTPRELKLKLNM